MIRNRYLQDTQYATHLPVLISAVMHTNGTGTVIELGAGDFSTPILHEICKTQNRLLYTFENNEKWLNNFSDLQTKRHRLLLVSKWDTLFDYFIDDPEISVCFIDHSPAKRRPLDIQKLRNKVDIFVVHDTEPAREGTYKIAKTLASFKYRNDYVRYVKRTTLLSDKIDVRKFL